MDGQTHRQMNRHKDGWADTQTDEQTQRWMGRHTDRWIDTKTDRQTHRQMDRHKDGRTDAQSDGQAQRQLDAQMDRQPLLIISFLPYSALLVLFSFAPPEIPPTSVKKKFRQKISRQRIFKQQLSSSWACTLNLFVIHATE